MAVSVTFGRTVARRGVSFAVPPNELVGLLGPNGAGKTTLVRVLATLLRPDEGTAQVGGFDVVRQPIGVRQVIRISGSYFLPSFAQETGLD
jgi:oleandomycin transport system ATP-binding protein